MRIEIYLPKYMLLKKSSAAGNILWLLCYLYSRISSEILQERGREPSEDPFIPPPSAANDSSASPQLKSAKGAIKFVPPPPTSSGLRSNGNPLHFLMENRANMGNGCMGCLVSKY